jgi:iron complex outermembrane receptor protein
MKRYIDGATLSAAALVCSLAALPAYAQQIAVAPQPDQPALAPGAAATAGKSDEAPSAGLGEIQVTARRVSEDIERVPVSVTAVGAEGLRDQQIVDINGLELVSPSLTVSQGQRGSSSPVVMIRGQRGFNSNTLQDPSVSVYFADVGQSLAGGLNTSFYDLQSVEVLKGPQGTLFGRNTNGGAVLINPAVPGDKFDGYFQVSDGNYDYHDVEGMVNLPVSDTLAVRFAGKLTRRHGYMEDPDTGVDAENLNSNSGRLSARWKPNDDFESTTIATYYDDDTNDARSLYVVNPPSVIPGGPLAAYLVPLYEAALARNQSQGKYEFEDNGPEFSKSQIYGIQNISKWDIPSAIDELSIKNIFGYRHVYTDANFDLDGSPVQSLGTISLLRADIYSNELQVLGKKGPLDFVAGFTYYRQNALDDSLSSEFGALNPLAPSTFPISSYGDYDTENRSYALYANGNYKLDSLAKGLSVSVGARVTEDVRGIVYHNRTAGGFNPTTYICTLTGAVIPNNRNLCATEAADLEYTRPSFNASVNYQATDDVLVYGAFRRGYRAGGFNNSPPNAASIETQIFRPETVNDYEIGLKANFRIGGIPGRFNLAGYHDLIYNAQRTDNEVIPGTSTFAAIVLNAAQAHVNGGEAELTLDPTDSLRLSANGSVIDTGYSSFVDHYLVNGVVTPVDVSDSQFAYVPKYQINSTARYQLPIPRSSGDVFVQATYYYQSTIQTAEINTANCGPNGQYYNCDNRLGAVHGYSFINMRADWRNVAGAGFDLGLFVNNLTNKYYISDASNAIGTIGYASSVLGPPRMFGVELRVPFGASRY